VQLVAQREPKLIVWKDPQTELRVRLKDLAAARVRYGYECLHTLLVCEGWQTKLKRVCRFYHEEGLSFCD
jgi:putative transposase